MKHLIIAIFSIIVTLGNLHAQSGCFSRIDSIEFGTAEAIVSNDAGEYYVTGLSGATSIYNGGTPIVNKHYGAFLAKFNQNHEILWLKNQEGNGYQNSSNAIAIDNVGNIIIGGWYYDYIIFGKDSLSAQNGGGNNAFITKFRPDGSPIWSKRVHTPGLISGSKIISLSADGLGNIYFGGSFGGSLIFGQDSIQSWKLGDNFWGKMDSMGNIQWIKAAGSKLVETGVNVAADSIGNLYVIGDVTNINDSAYVDDTLNFKGFGFIAKYSPNGQMKWLKGAEKGDFYMGTRTTGGKIQYKNGFVIAAGTMVSDSNIVSIAGAQTVIDPNTRGPAFVLKLDTAGNGLWLKDAVSTYYDVDVMGVAIKNNGNIALTTYNGYYIEGDSLSNLTYKTPIYLSLNGNNGKVINYCYPKQPGSGSYLSRGITSINDTIFATGSFDLKTNGHSRIFIATIPPNTVGIEEQYIENQNINIYPNPSENGAFTLDLSEVKDIEIQQLNVYNLNGQMVYSQKIKVPKNQKISFQLNGLAKGIYIISLQHSKGVITKKLVVQ